MEEITMVSKKKKVIAGAVVAGAVATAALVGTEEGRKKIKDAAKKVTKEATDISTRAASKTVSDIAKEETKKKSD